MSPNLTGNKTRSPEHRALLTACSGVENLARALEDILRCDARPSLANNINRKAEEALAAFHAVATIKEAHETCKLALLKLQRDVLPFTEAEEREAEATFWSEAKARASRRTAA